ncbi:MAG TPA: hypothetical protein VGJ73_12860, partial [Verrucomicrobiae bacterium]
MFIISSLGLMPSASFAQGTAFTYNGSLSVGGQSANGNYDMRFSLFTSATGGATAAGPITNSVVTVSNGLFATTIDFGAGIFNDTSYWLDISVSPTGSNTFTELAPRQTITPVPYAIYSENAGNAASATSAEIAGAANSVSAANITGALQLTQLPESVVVNNENNVTLGGTFNGNGGGLTNLNVSAAQLTSIGNINGGVGNFFVGSAGNSATSGSQDTALGHSALFGDTTGVNNTAVGAQALSLNTTGNDNVADGFEALDSNVTGGGNTASGAFALDYNSNGVDNTACGFETLTYVTSGSYDTAIGDSALGNLGVNNGFGGDNDIALGHDAGSAFTGNESSNIDIGNIGVDGESGVIRIGTSGIQSAAYIAGVINGNGAGLTNLNISSYVVNASQLTSIGNTNGGVGNFFVGPAGNSTTSGSQNTAVGYLALIYNNIGVNNTANGAMALENNTNGSANTADGGHALISNTTGDDNEAGGFGALAGNVGGSDNTATGAAALNSNTNGNYNTAVGFEALAVNKNGSGNIGLGFQAGFNFTGNENNDIDIGNSGVTGEDGTIRIGTSGIQTNTFIAGVINGNGAGLTNLNVSQSSGVISLAQLPAAVVTNNETSGITLDNLTLSGVL